MKYHILLLILFVYFLYTNAFAQNTNDSCINLRYPVYRLNQIDSIGNISYAGNNKVPDYFSKNDFLSLPCNRSTGCDDSNGSLVYDVYYPSPTAYKHYNTQPLPAVILFHSGGFSDCSDKAFDATSNYCKAFAQRGFVAFNVEYRRGRLKDGQHFSPEQALAIYRAVQDGNGAVRSIVKRQINNKTVYKIDTSRLFIGGSSSGAITALHIGVCNQQEMDKAFPGVSDSGILGPVKKNNYFGGLNISFSIKGVLSMWGALEGAGGSNPNFPSCITAKDKVPVILFHGERDVTVPDSTIKAVFSTGARATVSQCNFIYHLTSATGFDYQYGSIPIYQRLKSLNIPAELYLDSDATHGLSSTSNYGLPTSNIDSVEDYIVGRAAIFFKAVMDNATGNIKQTLFKDKEDTTTNCDYLTVPITLVNRKNRHKAILLSRANQTL